ncbi:hypothetical protein [Actinoplanes sp. NPDC048796]|uniref:hypothetical protein n=1 Tax=Actinoplanes sp. NPDC048796 TaxID=3155640 RepID=UPI0033E3DE48
MSCRSVDQFWLTGAPWRDLPERCGPWKTCHERLRDWLYRRPPSSGRSGPSEVTQAAHRLRWRGNGLGGYRCGRARGTHHSSACGSASGALRGAGSAGRQPSRAVFGRGPGG